jgi:hypothetical protein
MGREGGFAGVGVFGFSVMLVEVVVVDAGCEAVLLLDRFLEDEAESTKAGAMTRGEETEDEEEP